MPVALHRTREAVRSCRICSHRRFTSSNDGADDNRRAAVTPRASPPPATPPPLPRSSAAVPNASGLWRTSPMIRSSGQHVPLCFFQAALYIERKTVSARARSISASRSAARALKYLAARPRRNNWNTFAHSSMVLLANLGPAYPYLPAKVCVGPSIQSK
jgi:hypothetical protein